MCTETSLEVNYFLVFPALLVSSEVAPSSVNSILVKREPETRVNDLVAVELELLADNYYFHLIASAQAAKSSQVSSL